MILAYVPRVDAKNEANEEETAAPVSASPKRGGGEPENRNEPDPLAALKNLIREEDAQTVRERKFRTITDKMFDVYHRKNLDYGNAFGESVKEFGLVAAAVRIGDKYRRIRSLVDRAAMVKEESVKDTLIDLANYAIMTLIEMENA